MSEAPKHRDASPRTFAIALACAALLCACKAPDERLPPMPSVRARAHAEPAFDPNRPLDFRLVRVRPEAHLDKERICDVVFVGAAESVTRRNGRRYPIKPAARRLIRCGSEQAESYVDLVFPPDARSFVSAITVGIRLRVQVIAIDGGFEDAPVVSFIAVLDGASEIIAPRPPLRHVAIADDVDRFARTENAPQKLRCAIAYARPLERIGQTRAHRFPRGATSHSLVSCRGPRGERWVDVVFTPRTAIQSLALMEGRIVRLSRLHPHGGEGNRPFAILLDGP